MSSNLPGLAMRMSQPLGAGGNRPSCRLPSSMQSDAMWPRQEQHRGATSPINPASLSRSPLWISHVSAAVDDATSDLSFNPLTSTKSLPHSRLSISTPCLPYRSAAGFGDFLLPCGEKSWQVQLVLSTKRRCHRRTSRSPHESAAPTSNQTLALSQSRIVSLFPFQCPIQAMLITKRWCRE